MRQFVRTLLCCLLVASAMPAAGQEHSDSNAAATRTAAAGRAPVSISTAINERAARRAKAGRSNEFEPPQQAHTRPHSWVRRHPVLSGALIGSAAGALGGATPGSDCGHEETFCSRAGMVQISTVAGAGVGALVGLVVHLVR